MVNVGVRADDRLDREAPPAKEFENAGNFIAGIHHERFVRERVPNDRAIALQHPDGNSDVNQTLLGGIEGRQASQVVSHTAIIALPFDRTPQSARSVTAPQTTPTKKS